MWAGQIRSGSRSACLLDSHIEIQLHSRTERHSVCVVLGAAPRSWLSLGTITGHHHWAQELTIYSWETIHYYIVSPWELLIWDVICLQWTIWGLRWCWWEFCTAVCSGLLWHQVRDQWMKVFCECVKRTQSAPCSRIVCVKVYFIEIYIYRHIYKDTHCCVY